MSDVMVIIETTIISHYMVTIETTIISHVMVTIETTKTRCFEHRHNHYIICYSNHRNYHYITCDGNHRNFVEFQPTVHSFSLSGLRNTFVARPVDGEMMKIQCLKIYRLNYPLSLPVFNLVSRGRWFQARVLAPSSWIADRSRLLPFSANSDSSV